MGNCEKQRGRKHIKKTSSRKARSPEVALDKYVYRVGELAQIWGVTRRTVQRLIKAKKLKILRIGDLVRIPNSEKVREPEYMTRALKNTMRAPRFLHDKHAYRTGDLAEIWDVSQRTVRRLINTGKLKAFGSLRTVRVLNRERQHFEMGNLT